MNPNDPNYHQNYNQNPINNNYQPLNNQGHPILLQNQPRDLNQLLINPFYPPIHTNQPPGFQPSCLPGLGPPSLQQVNPYNLPMNGINHIIPNTSPHNIYPQSNFNAFSQYLSQTPPGSLQYTSSSTTPSNGMFLHHPVIQSIPRQLLNPNFSVGGQAPYHNMYQDPNSIYPHNPYPNSIYNHPTLKPITSSESLTDSITREQQPFQAPNNQMIQSTNSSSEPLINIDTKASKPKASKPVIVKPEKVPKVPKVKLQEPSKESLPMVTSIDEQATKKQKIIVPEPSLLQQASLSHSNKITDSEPIQSLPPNPSISSQIIEPENISNLSSSSSKSPLPDINKDSLAQLETTQEGFLAFPKYHVELFKSKLKAYEIDAAHFEAFWHYLTNEIQNINEKDHEFSSQRISVDISKKILDASINFTNMHASKMV